MSCLLSTVHQSLPSPTSVRVSHIPGSVTDGHVRTSKIPDRPVICIFKRGFIVPRSVWNPTMRKWEEDEVRWCPATLQREYGSRLWCRPSPPHPPSRQDTAAPSAVSYPSVCVFARRAPDLCVLCVVCRVRRSVNITSLCVMWPGLSLLCLFCVHCWDIFGFDYRIRKFITSY